MQMYADAMTGVTQHLLHKTPNAKLTYTSELVPQRTKQGGMCVFSSILLRHLSLLSNRFEKSS